MVILGVADGIDAGAALVVDDRIVAVSLQDRLDRVSRSNAFPWAAIDDVLSRGGVSADEVEKIAVAGRFTPPFFVRRHPGARQLTRDPFSAAGDANVLWQAVLRRSGFGALEADRACAWLDARFTARGFRPRRVTLVEIHRALAAAAYRCQPDPRALVVTLHPKGDGVALAVHQGHSGQLDQVSAQGGLGSLHVHLPRCAAALGLDPWLDEPRLWGLASRGQPSDRLLERLRQDLDTQGSDLVRRRTPGPCRPTDPPFGDLAAAPVEVAAASILENLQAVVATVIGARVGASDARTVAVGGAMFDNPRLVASVADVPGVARVETAPLGGSAALSLGAALSQGGVAPARVHPRDLGAAPNPDVCRQAARSVGTPGEVDPRRVAEVLAGGGGVARFAGGHGWSRCGGCTRSILVRADDPEAVERVRRAIGLPEGSEPALAASSGVVQVRNAAALTGPMLYGTVAPQVTGTVDLPGAVTADGRVHLLWIPPDQDPELSEILDALGERTGVRGAAVWPLAPAGTPIVTHPRGAVDLARRGGLGGLQLGNQWVEIET